jgi:catechol 2,3-dioxygenase-like lactoylglutathione lyase family enzyme
MSFKSVDHYGIVVENLDRSIPWWNQFWALPGGTVIEMLEYHNPAPGRVDMESYNVGNTHLCFETEDIRADYERLRDHAEFRSPEPVQSVWGPYRGTLVCYLRDPDGISIELVQFPEKGRPFQGASPYANPYAAADPE